MNGAEAKWSSGTSFKRVINGFKTRLHCQIHIGRLAYQRGQLSVKQSLLALQVRLLPDRPWRVTRSGDQRCLLNRWSFTLVVRLHCSPPFENVV